MPTQTAIILKQDGTVEEVQYAEKDSLATLQAAVGGRIESVDWMGFGMDAYANEEGLYTPGLHANGHVAAVLGQIVLGNVVIPRVTDSKRARLRKKGFEV
jgi:hypothetical protein